MKRHRLVVVALAAVAVFAATACEGSAGRQAKSGSSIEVVALWQGTVEAAFLRVAEQFTKDTGINVTYTPVFDFTRDMYSRVAAGNPPDIAIVPQHGFIARMAKRGVLKDLSTMGITKAYMKARYGPIWIGYGTVGDKLYGVPTRASSKSWIWYRPDQFRKYRFTIPKTWSQFLALTKAMKAKGLVPWAVGAGADSQWVLGDWVEIIYARMFGPTKYQALFTGKVPFTDPSVTKAIRYMVQIVNRNYALGGIAGVLTSTMVDGIGDVFGTKAKAQLYYEGGFVGDIAIGQFNPNLEIGKTIGHFPWPALNPRWDGGSVTVGADYAIAFKDGPKVKEFLRYITSAKAGKIWVSTGAVVPNKLVPSSAYPNKLTRDEAAQLASAKAVLFDGDDQMPVGFANTWCFGLQRVIKNPSVANINKIEADFQKKIAGQWGR